MAADVSRARPRQVPRSGRLRPKVGEHRPWSMTAAGGRRGGAQLARVMSDGTRAGSVATQLPAMRQPLGKIAQANRTRERRQHVGEILDRVDANDPAAAEYG